MKWINTKSTCLGLQGAGVLTVGQHEETLINSFYLIKEKLFISLAIPKEQNSNLYNKVMMIILTAVECLHEMSQQMQNMKTESQIETCVQTRLTKLSRWLKLNMGNNLSLLNIEYLILLWIIHFLNFVKFHTSLTVRDGHLSSTPTQGWSPYKRTCSADMEFGT